MTGPCPFCGAAIPVTSYYCIHCKRNLPTDASGRPALQMAPDTLQAELKGRWYCTHCGVVANPRTYTKGSFLIELVLWLMMILPGLLYSLWRLASRYHGCPQCGAANMIPVDSPAAQRLLQKT